MTTASQIEKNKVIILNHRITRKFFKIILLTKVCFHCVVDREHSPWKEGCITVSGVVISE